MTKCECPVAILALVVAWAAPAWGADDIDFGRDVRPILKQHCFKCHGTIKQQGGLRFDHRDGAIREGDSGEKSIVPGSAEASELIRRVISDDESFQMPPEGERLTAEEIDLLRRWIDGGAPWPESADFVPVGGELTVTDEDRQHWSFRPLRQPPIPAVESAERVRTPIDAFIFAALDKLEVSPAEQASPRKLIRRLKFDVIGLPPTPEEVSEFEAASGRDPQATEALIDRSLESPHYGERWARHWLDVARYADSDGLETDADRPFAYRYRDFVIRALNDDLPFDTFVRWQIAGDELDRDDPRAVAATGFLAAGPSVLLGTNRLEEERLFNRYNEMDDIISTFGSGLLGLTMGCARCHDHKYDPIPTRDYYRLMSAFHSGERADVLLGDVSQIEAYERAEAHWKSRLQGAEQELEKWVGEQRKRLEPALRAEKIAELDVPPADKQSLLDPSASERCRELSEKYAAQIAVSDDELKEALAPEDRQRWTRLSEAIEQVHQSEPASPPAAYAFQDETSQPRLTWLFSRGDFHDRSQPVALGFLTVLSRAKPAEQYWDEARSRGTGQSSTYQRAALADWVTDVEQGAGALLARVIVNRVWQHHFGRGLVATPNDFGVQGERPTHPELLEWLAHDFVAHGWRLKRLHRQILASAVYLQDTKFDEDKAKLDPYNRFLWRRQPVRLEAEVLRDSMLFVAGTLNLEPYGPGFKPPIAAEAMSARNVMPPYEAEPADSPNIRRRSIYMFHKRVVPYPLMQVFDRPDSQQSCGRRERTLVATQSLSLLNDPFIRDRAAEFAERLLREAPDSRDLAGLAFEAALGRPPDEQEKEMARGFVITRLEQRRRRAMGQEEDALLLVALTDYCQALFGLNEFLYIE
jgi:hypothetical protein